MNDTIEERVIFDPTHEEFIAMLDPNLYYLCSSDVWTLLPDDALQKQSGVWVKIYLSCEFFHIDNLPRGSVISLMYDALQMAVEDPPDDEG